MSSPFNRSAGSKDTPKIRRTDDGTVPGTCGPSSREARKRVHGKDTNEVVIFGPGAPKQQRRTDDGTDTGTCVASSSEARKRVHEKDMNEIVIFGPGATKQQKIDVCDQPSTSGPSNPVPVHLKTTSLASSMDIDSSDGIELPYPKSSRGRVYVSVEEEIKLINYERRANIEIRDDDVPTVPLNMAMDIMHKIINYREDITFQYFYQLLENKLEGDQAADDKYLKFLPSRLNIRKKGNDGE